MKELKAYVVYFFRVYVGSRGRLYEDLGLRGLAMQYFRDLNIIKGQPTSHMSYSSSSPHIMLW